MSDPRHALGRRGERIAGAHLKAQGCRILARNYRCPAGEIDLIARDGETVVFVEVKTRRDAVHADPEDAVGFRKQRQIIKAARYFLRQARLEDRPCRFDVLAVVMPESAADAKHVEPVIRHIRDAFVPGTPT